MLLNDVTINILNFNKAEMTAKTLKGVLTAKIGGAKIHVLDNGSKDEEYEKLKTLLKPFKRIKLYRVSPNRGFAGGHNYLISKTKTRYALMLNNDVRVTPTWLVNLMHSLKANPQEALSGPMVDYNPEEKHGNLLAMNLLFRHVLNPPANGPQEFVVEGACMALDLKKIPMPFDTDYYIYNEDSYLSFCVRALGYKIGHCKSSRVFHYGSATTKGDTKFFYGYFHERNRLWNILILYDYFTIIRIFPLILLDMLGFLIKIGRRNPENAWKVLKCYGETLLKLPLLMKKHADFRRKKKLADPEVTKMIYGSVLQGNSVIAKVVNKVALTYLRLVGIRAAEHYL